MKKRDYKKFFIIVLILFISIGFAYLSTNMNLKGTGIFKENSWDIYFDNLIEESYKTEITSAATIESKTTIDFSINLKQPKSSYTMYANIVNDGSIDAMLDSFTINNTLDENEEKAIDIKVSYSDGVELTKNDLLKENSFDTIKVIVIYKNDIDSSELLSNDGDFNFSVTLNYIQADEDAADRKQGWDYFYIVDQTPFNNSYSDNNETIVRCRTRGGWEMMFKKLYLKTGQKYRISFDYEIVNSYTTLATYYEGIGIQIINSKLLGNNDLSGMQIARKYLSSKVGSYSENIEFIADNENSFVFNVGMARDEQDIEFKVSNYKIQKVD